MILAPDDAALFYRAWGELLVWVNQQRNVVPAFPPPTPDHPIAPHLANQVRKVLWADDTLREGFLERGAAGLGGAERELVASWRQRVTDSFVLYKHLRNHSILLGGEVFAVRGIFSPLAELVFDTPSLVVATLLPFRDVIIIDGFLESMRPHLSFGPGIRRGLKEQYDTARKRSRIRTRLAE